jgi:hypothetical protein
MYPPMELLLRHAIQFFDLSPRACSAKSNLDSAAMMRRVMPMLPLHEQQLTAHVYLLAALLDGAPETAHNAVGVL